MTTAAESWRNASIEELRTLYADRLADLEYEYNLRIAAEEEIERLRQRLIEADSLQDFPDVPPDLW